MAWDLKTEGERSGQIVQTVIIIIIIKIPVPFCDGKCLCCTRIIEFQYV